MRACALLLCGALAACQGPRGPAGEMGETGPRGGEGADGKPGADGVDGKDGTDGADGLTGATGARGPAGPAGPRGPSGAPGSDADAGTMRGYEPGVWVSCVGLLDLIGSSGGLGTDGVGETLLNYRVTAYVGRDVDVQCSGALGAAMSGSGGGYLPAATAGAQDAGCIASVDYPPTGTNAGFWDFTIVAGSGPRATYKDDDAGHPLAGMFYAFTESDCSVLVNDGDGWKSSTIAAVF